MKRICSKLLSTIVILCLLSPSIAPRPFKLQFRGKPFFSNNLQLDMKSDSETVGENLRELKTGCIKKIVSFLSSVEIELFALGDNFISSGCSTFKHCRQMRFWTRGEKDIAPIQRNIVTNFFNPEKLFSGIELQQSLISYFPDYKSKAVAINILKMTSRKNE